MSKDKSDTGTPDAAEKKAGKLDIESEITNIKSVLRRVISVVEKFTSQDLDKDGKIGRASWSFLGLVGVGMLIAFAAVATEKILWKGAAPSGDDAVFQISADNGEDTNDELQLYIDNTSNAFHVSIGGTDVMTVSSGGTLVTTVLTAGSTNYTADLTLENSEILDNGVDGTIQFRNDGVAEDMLFDLYTAKEAGTVTLSLTSDGDDDVGDKFALQSTDGTLNIQNDTTSAGTLATIMAIDSDGMITMRNSATIDNDTSSTILTLTETTIALAGDVTVSGTLGQTGVATFTALPIFNAGVDINEDIDIDLDATDEEIDITQTNAAGTADIPLMAIHDNRTGATANTAGESTLWIDAEGTHAIGVIDGIVAVESILDTYAAGSLLLGSATATKLELADTTVETEIQGTLDVQEAASFSSTIGLTDADGAATITITGFESSDAVLILDADVGGDATDTWTIESEATGNDLSIMNAATEVLNLTSAGALQIDGDLTVTGNDIVSAAAKMTIAGSVSTSLDLGAAGIDTTILGPLNVLEATTKGIDTTGAGALYIGEQEATSVVLGASDAHTTVAGDLTVTGLDIDSAAGAMTIGKATATSVEIADASVTTDIQGPLKMAGTSVAIATNLYTLTPVGSVELLSASVAITTATLANATSAGQILKVINVGTGTVVIADSANVQSTGALTLGQWDSAEFVGELSATNWVMMGTSNN